MQYPSPIAPPEPTPAIAPAGWDEAETLIPLEGWREFLPTFVGIFRVLGGFYLLMCVGLWLSKAPPAELAQAIRDCLAYAAIAGLLCGCMISIGQTLTPLRIGKSGIRTRKFARNSRRWDDIVEVREKRFLRLGSYIVLKTEGSRTLSLPSYLMQRDDFRAAVLTHAPADNPLRK